MLDLGRTGGIRICHLIVIYEKSYWGRLSFVEMEKKNPEAELGGFEGLQMQPAETS